MDSRRRDMIGRIERTAGLPGLADALADRLAGADLRSLLLEASARRAGRRSPADLLAQAGRDRTVRPAAADPRRLHRVEGLALEAARGFSAVALSPVAPLGLNAVLGGMSQDRILSTVRGSEVLADPTAALALAAAERRHAGEATVRLCAAARALRLQRFPAPYNQHFSLFSMVTAGRSRADHAFEVDALREHLSCHLLLLRSAAAAGVRGRVTVAISDTRLTRSAAAAAGVDLDGAVRSRAPMAESCALFRRAGLDVPELVDGVDAVTDVLGGVVGAGSMRRLAAAERGALRPLREAFPEARFGLAPARAVGLGYYDGLALDVTVEDAAGMPLPLVDGGTVDWTARLLSDRRERLLVSGVGLELVPGAVEGGMP
jgi:hypothetical protein